MLFGSVYYGCSMNRKLLTGLLYIIISAIFFIGGLGYQFNNFENPGPALFPVLISVMLFVLGATSVAQSFRTTEQIGVIHIKNIATIVLGLVGFAVATEYLDMVAGITVLVAITSFSALTPSLSQNIKLTIGLVAVAFVFKNLLGLNLPLWK